MSDFRFRQVHLDFHTSPHIPGIGASFDRRQWQETLRLGHVDSITTFAVCHHGWSYYDTKVGKRHPNLKFDLLRAQYEASKEIGVNVPIYLTAGVNDQAVSEHPEWREVDHNGQYLGWSKSVLEPGFRKVCFNTPYLDRLCAQIQEVATLFPGCDGIFLDIISQGPCCCPWCQRSMQAGGYDMNNADDRRRHARQVLREYYRRTTEALRQVSPTMRIFHNSGHITRGERDILQWFSHLELESLPTGGWGYDHFPMSAKYAAKLGLDFLGMTGKFHGTWGEFGGFKHPNALRYECAAMIAFGARCSVGDQLHPSAELDASTYGLIGAAYAEVEQKEPWCRGARNLADIGVLSCEAIESDRHDRNNAPDVGAVRVLLEEQLLFDILDADMDFSPYKVLVLPDRITVDVKLKAKLDAYLARGGKLFLTGDSGLDPDQKGFVFDLGAEFGGPAPCEPDYVFPGEALRPDFIQTPWFMKTRSNRLRVTTGQALGEVIDSYFNRTWEHYCSHQHTPNRLEPSGFACGVRQGQILYLAHPVFSIYAQQGMVACRQYVGKALRLLLGEDQTLRSNLPSSGRLALAEQPAEQRLVLHLLHAVPSKRGNNVEVIEDLLPLHDVEVSLRHTGKFKGVTLEPQGIPAQAVDRDGVCTVKIPAFTCHQMVVFHQA